MPSSHSQFEEFSGNILGTACSNPYSVLEDSVSQDIDSDLDLLKYWLF